MKFRWPPTGYQLAAIVAFGTPVVVAIILLVPISIFSSQHPGPGDEVAFFIAYLFMFVLVCSVIGFVVGGTIAIRTFIKRRRTLGEPSSDA